MKCSRTDRFNISVYCFFLFQQSCGSGFFMGRLRIRVFLKLRIRVRSKLSDQKYSFKFVAKFCNTIIEEEKNNDKNPGQIFSGQNCLDPVILMKGQFWIRSLAQTLDFSDWEEGGRTKQCCSRIQEKLQIFF